jgi:DHA1 family bicyclomycin/chloramphenicol resistance-like MFS transporter
VLALLLGLQPLTTDLYLPALPMLAADLAAPGGQVQLTMSALILSFGLAQLAWGPVADRVGRRPVLLLGLALYALASAGAALAGSIAWVILWRAVQGACLGAAVVCARAMVRDLYQPHQGAHVMAKALTGLGMLAIVAPLLGGAVATAFGWRATMAVLALVGLALAGFLALQLPETATRRNPQATRLGPLLAQAREILRHPGFRSWALLVACTYGALFVFLSGATTVFIRGLGLSPLMASVALVSSSVVYIAGTALCRRWLPRYGLAGSSVRAAGFSAAGALAMALVAWAGWQSLWAVLIPQWLFVLGHGVHQPCGQAGAVAFFPRAAGLASALAGFVLAAVAFGIGLWLGRVLDGSPAPLLATEACFAALTALVSATLVRRHGEPAR